MLSDIFPTAWFGGGLADVGKGDTVAVFGCGPVGMFSILSAQLQDAGRVLAIDQLGSRLGELTGAIDAYASFDQRAEGWHKVALDPASTR